MLEATHLVFVAVPALVLCAWLSWSRVSHLKTILRCILVLYLLGVIGITLFPLPVLPSTISVERAAGPAGHIQHNLVPGKCFTDASRAAEEAKRHGYGAASSLWLYIKPVVGNLLMLLPLGYLLPWVSDRWRRWWRTVAAVAATTVAIEILQLLGTIAYGFSYKSFDVDDLWLNLLGGLMGYGLFRLTAPSLEGSAWAGRIPREDTSALMLASQHKVCEAIEQGRRGRRRGAASNEPVTTARPAG